MKVIKMDAQGLSPEEQARLAQRVCDVAKDFSDSSEDLKVCFYDRQSEQPRH